MILAVILGMAAPAAAERASVTIEVVPDVGTMADTFVATVRVEVPGGRGAERLWPPSFADFTVIGQTSSSTTARGYNSAGELTMTTIELYRFELRPKRIGRLHTGSATVRFRGEEHTSREAVVTVKMRKAAEPSSLPDTISALAPDDPTAESGIGAPGFRPPRFVGPLSKRPQMFLYAVVSAKEVYVGQQVTVTWLLFTRDEILKFEPRVPRLSDVWSEVLYEPSSYFRYHDYAVEGVPYQVVVVSKRALFPLVPGKITVEPFAARVSSLYTPVGSAEELASQPVTIMAKPLPGGAPPDFDPSYVGVFFVEAEVDRRSLEAGSSLTLTVSVRGQGAISRTVAPTVASKGFSFRTPRDFAETIYPSTERIAGERIYRYWATPTQSGALEIAPVTIHYFDPESGSYEQTSSEPISIAVTGDPNAVGTPQTPGAARQNLIPRDIRLLRTSSRVSSRTVSQLYLTRWFWLLSTLPFLCFVAIYVGSSLRRRRREETPRARIRRARGQVRKHYRLAEEHMRAGKAAPCFAALSRAIYEFIEEHIGEPVQPLTRAELRDLLLRKGMAAATIDRMEAELDRCDFARFGSTAAGPGEMKQAMLRVRELLREVEKTAALAHGSGEKAL